MILAVDHHHGRALEYRVAGNLAGLCFPAFGKHVMQAFELFAVVVGMTAFQFHFAPVHGVGREHVAGHELRCLGVIEIGQYEDGGRVFAEAVDHLVEADTHILHADFLGHDEVGHGRMLVVQVTHGIGQHGGIAHAGIEQAQGRRAGLDVLELLGDALGDGGFFVTGVDERQVVLPVVVEAERRVVFLVAGCRCGSGFAGLGLALDGFGFFDCFLGGFGCGHVAPLVIFNDANSVFIVLQCQEILDPVDGPERDALAIAQAVDQFAVVDHSQAERGLGYLLPVAVGLDFPDQ